MDKKDMPRRREAMELRIRRTMAALEKNNMSAYYAPESADAVRIVEELLGEGDVISCGGSVTLDASGVKALMRSGKYDFLDRDAVETDAERQAIYRRTFSADAFLTSSNAITERGELYVKAVSVPANALRLHIDTPCTHAACPGTDGDLCGGCASENRLCAQYTIMARQRVKGRVHVILVGEELGY